MCNQSIAMHLPSAVVVTATLTAKVTHCSDYNPTHFDATLKLKNICASDMRSQFYSELAAYCAANKSRSLGLMFGWLQR